MAETQAPSHAMPDNTPPPTARSKTKTKSPFHGAQQNERSTIKLHIEKWLGSRSSKSSITAQEDKWSVLVKKREEKIAERVEEGKGSLEQMFPEKFDSAAEDTWLKKTYRLFLDAGGDGQNGRDEDDDEIFPTPPRPRGRKLNVKVEAEVPVMQTLASKPKGRKGKEPKQRSEIMSYFGDSGLLAGEPSHVAGRRTQFLKEQDYDHDDEEEIAVQEYVKPKKAAVGIPSQRSYAIIHGTPGLTELHAQLKAEARRAKQGVVVGVAFTPGFGVKREVKAEVKEEVGGKRKREDAGVEVVSQAKRVKQQC